jgi:hypothetical protein
MSTNNYELLYIIIINTLLSFYYVTDMGENRNQLMMELFSLSEDQPNKQIKLNLIIIL